MSRTVSVAIGDHISAIAEEAGFARFETLYEAEENAELRAIRPNPHQLVPGDLLVLPDKASKAEALAVDRSFQVTITRQRLFLRLKVLDYFGEPLKGESGALDIDGRSLPVTTDGDGFMQVGIPRTSKRAELTIAGMKFPLRIGALQPKSEVEGVRARLTNMGYWAGGKTVEDGGVETEFSLGIELFQEDAGLDVDGRLTGAAIDELTRAHGQ